MGMKDIKIAVCIFICSSNGAEFFCGVLASSPPPLPLMTLLFLPDAFQFHVWSGSAALLQTVSSHLPLGFPMDLSFEISFHHFLRDTRITHLYYRAN